MVKELKDNLGNSIIAVDTGNKINLFLKLISESRKRKLGYVNKIKRELVVRRNREKHLHRNSQSYGFNFELINTATKFDKIVLKDNYRQFTIKREELLNSGFFLFFQKQGFEKQIFYRVEV